MWTHFDELMSRTLFSGPGPSVGVLSTMPQGSRVTPCPALAPQTRRTAFQCLQKYQQHNPALKRREWTEEEDRMLTRLVQAMRVGSHIPYRRSESRARRAGPHSQLGGRGRCCDVQATCDQFSVVSVAPLWGTQEVQRQPAPSVRSCLLHGGPGLHAAHLPLDQEPGPRPEEGALGPRGGRGVSAGLGPGA